MASPPMVAETGKPRAINSFTVQSLYWNEGPKSPDDDLAEVAEVLLQQWLIQMIVGIQICPDLRRQDFFSVKWPAWRHADQEKSQS